MRGAFEQCANSAPSSADNCTPRARIRTTGTRCMAAGDSHQVVIQLRAPCSTCSSTALLVPTGATELCHAAGSCPTANAAQSDVAGGGGRGEGVATGTGVGAAAVWAAGSVRSPPLTSTPPLPCRDCEVANRAAPTNATRATNATPWQRCLGGGLGWEPAMRGGRTEVRSGAWAAAAKGAGEGHGNGELLVVQTAAWSGGIGAVGLRGSEWEREVEVRLGLTQSSAPPPLHLTAL